MNNDEALGFFSNLATSKPDEKTCKITKNGASDFTDIDAKFIAKYLKSGSCILDLGSGSGLTVNKLSKNSDINIVAVEAFKEFSHYIKEKENVEVVNADIRNFITDKKFDLISFFGIMHYFNEEEANGIYNKYVKYLKPNGYFIVKNQFGVKEDVVVSGFSQEQQTNYYSEYRFINKEVQILKNIGFKNIEIVDIYPPECNRWDNTHFYAIVAQKI